MKAYLYDVETGLYAGETFEEPDMLVYEDGITTLPPPAHEPNQVPVFDRASELWTLIPATTLRQLLYPSGER